MDELSFFEATGFSMWPFIKEGDKLIVKMVHLEDLKQGDVILYRKDTQLICHRLVKMCKDKNRYLLYVRGDNSLSQGELIDDQSFAGKVTGILKKGHIVDITSGRRNFINRLIMIAGPLLGMGSRIIKKSLSNK